MAIESTFSNHVKYDLNDMFIVVKTHQDLNEFETVNIYTYYPSLTAAEVSHSNAWYTTIMEDTHLKYFVQNLKLTHEYLANNLEEKLVTKVNETYL